jgi:hypothetical protein
MEIKITITVPGQIEPMEIKVDVPAEERNVIHVDPTDASVYAVRFNEGCTERWTKHPEMNMLFLIQQQDYANVKLKNYGYLSLNEVYDMLGCPRTKIGQVAGWVYTEDCSAGDNWVDFGLYDERNQDFINGLEPNALLDFNANGNFLKYL